MMTQLHKDPRDHKLKEDKSGIIRRINDKIQSFNRYREQSLCVRFSPNFHLFGLKIIKYDEVRAGDNPLIDAGVRVSISATQHRGPCWREYNSNVPGNNYDRCLHLSDEKRIQMGQVVIRYFEYLYKMKESLGDNKNEGIALKILRDNVSSK